MATGDLKESKTPVLLGWGVDDEVRFPFGGNSFLSKRLSLPPARGNAPTKVLWGFSFGTDRTPHDSRHQPWWLGVEAVLVTRKGGANP